MQTQRVVKLILVLGAVSLVFPTVAYAYIDPGTGAYIWQMALAGVLAVGYMVKVYWWKLRGIFRKGSSGDEADDD